MMKLLIKRKTVEDWRQVVSFGEIRANICGSDGGKYYWKRSTDLLQALDLDFTVKHGADLSSNTVDEILKNTASPKDFSQIKASLVQNPFKPSDYAQELIDDLLESPLSTRVLQNTLYQVGDRNNFDLILHYDAVFIVTKSRYFIDLMESPRNRLGQLTLERAAAIFTAIYIINQLFLVNNIILKLGWVERSFCGSDRTKWDGIIFNVGNRKLAPMLFEFSGGCNDKTSKTKESHDISKLYSKMVDMIKDLPPVAAKEMYYARFLRIKSTLNSL
ncbi:hypothetical protein G6F43_007364 [Rhizopus delemar]|nr:hypothetical protein G6F43_007364 [Rhizopus delemar]